MREPGLKVIVSIDQIKQPLTGVGRYSYELVNELLRLPEVEVLRYFRGVRFDSDLLGLQARAGGPGKFSRRLLAIPGVMEMYRKVTSFRQARALRGYDDYLFHGTSFYLPPFPGRSVVTIHDLSPINWPECHPPERVRFMEAEMALSVERASLLITDSRFTRAEVAHHYGKRIEDIHAIPLASAPYFFPRQGAELEGCLKKHGLAYQGYSLYVGTIEPRKNILALLDAYERLPVRLRQQWPLVLTGHHGWRSEKIHERISRGSEAGWVKYLGFAESDDLPLIYAGAKLFVFPSLYEGFGLPVLEAMASGIPVVCSNSSSLPEVAEGIALMCEPHDHEALSGLIARGLEDEDWRAEARSLGLRRAKDFSWHRCAQETAKVYAKALTK